MERGEYLRLLQSRQRTEPGDADAETTGLEIVRAFCAGWPHVAGLLAEVDELDLVSREACLSRVLPITQFPEGAVQAAAMRCDLTPEALEESLRLRNVEWELLPDPIRALLQENELDAWPDEALVLAAFRRDLAGLTRRWERAIAEGEAA
jgi:hypothetical protein